MNFLKTKRFQAMETDSESNNLTAEALKRKERLQKLRNKVTGKTDVKSDDAAKADENLPRWVIYPRNNVYTILSGNFSSTRQTNIQKLQTKR